MAVRDMLKSEFARAKAWREKLGMTPQQLGDALGYSIETIYLMERGAVPKGRTKPIQPWTWLRYKRACGDLDAELNGRKKGRVFGW